MRAADELQALQEERKKVSPETAEAINQFLVKLRACVDDPAGNSSIENPFAPSSDPSLKIKFYDRTPEKQKSLGYHVRGEPHGSVGKEKCRQAIGKSDSAEIAEALFQYSSPEEVFTFPVTCCCGSECETQMLPIYIPYFKEAIVMASTCDACAYHRGRQILDDILVANEIVDEAHRCKKELIIFKVNFEKAYDSID